MNYDTINKNIYRLTIPYRDIYTTVYAIRTDSGDLLFDTATYDEDVTDYIVPFLEDISITKESLKYVFISHNHGDHAGGLKKLIECYPDITVISKYPPMKEYHKNANVVMPREGEAFLDILSVVSIPGHTDDSAAIFDNRTKTLITGDCLQLYGVYGSGKWGANITLIKEHIIAVNKLKNMEINHILTAHDYHPCGYSYEGRESIINALDACIEPFGIIRGLITDNPNVDDLSISKIYNSKSLPTLSEGIVTAVRNQFK